MIDGLLSLVLLVVAAFFPALAVVVDRRRAAAPRLLPPNDGAGAEVTVLLPLRDEEENVEACVRTLLQQDDVRQLIAIDDGSSDETPRLLESLRRADRRLQTISARPLPIGWRGKLNALQSGLAEAGESEWLLLTDADTRHARGLLRRALSTAVARRLDLLSIAGRQHAVGLGENLVVPPVFGLLDALVTDWRAVAEGDPPIANGQYILLRGSALRTIGGFTAIHGAPIDDVALAERVRESGFRIGFIRSKGLEIRMYRGWSEAVSGWRRNLGGIFGGRPWLVTLIAGIVLLPVVVLAIALVAGLWTTAVLVWLMAAAASALFRRGSGSAPAYGLVAPCDYLVLAACLLAGAADYRRGELVAWKGRPMSLR